MTVVQDESVVSCSIDEQKIKDVMTELMCAVTQFRVWRDALCQRKHWKLVSIMAALLGFNSK